MQLCCILHLIYLFPEAILLVICYQMMSMYWCAKIFGHSVTLYTHSVTNVYLYLPYLVRFLLIYSFVMALSQENLCFFVYFGFPRFLLIYLFHLVPNRENHEFFLGSFVHHDSNLKSVFLLNTIFVQMLLLMYCMLEIVVLSIRVWLRGTPFYRRLYDQWGVAWRFLCLMVVLISLGPQVSKKDIFGLACSLGWVLIVLFLMVRVELEFNEFMSVVVKESVVLNDWFSEGNACFKWNK